MKKRKRTPHRRRPSFRNPSPLLITVRVCPHVWNLRQKKAYRRLVHILDIACEKFDTRIIQYIVLGNHIHLLIESKDRVQLGRAMKGLDVRIAKEMNDLMGRHGQVIDHRYHSSEIKSLRGGHRAMRYVRENHRRHFAPKDEWRRGVTIDRCSSWAKVIALPQPRTFLASVDPFT
jgi:REP element-mobilizing transposase RayT